MDQVRTVSTALDHLVTEQWEETMADAAELDQAYPEIAWMRAVAVMASPDHPAPFTGDQVNELLARVQQEANRLLGREP